MYEPLFIGIDIGTQGTKGLLCRSDGTSVCEAFCPSKLIRPDANTVYENPEDILNSVLTVIFELTDRAGEASREIKALSIDAQMAGIMGIDKGFSPVTPLDSWLDTRCAGYTRLLREKAGDEAVKYSGGQFIHSHASKILWWKNEEPEAYSRIHKFIQPNAYVSGVLCGLDADSAFMDYTFLHFNMFSDNSGCTFNTAMLSDFGVDKDKMPEIVSPEKKIGTVTSYFAEKCGLPDGVTVIAGSGDTAASSLGAGITRTGLAYDVAGTASVFACCTDKFVPDTVYNTLMFSRSICDGLFLPLSYITGGGICLEWFSGITGKSLRTLDAEAENLPSSGDLFFIPHFGGRTFPIDDRMSGAFLGLGADTSKAAMHRAVMESVVFEYKRYYDILKKSGCILGEPEVIGVGGGAKSRIFAQTKADILGITYAVPEKTESAASAMALLAAHAAGFRTEPLHEIFKPDITARKYLPDASKTAYYASKAKKYLLLADGYGDYISGIR